MIVLTNTNEQTLQPGQSLVFDKVISRSGCTECHYTDTPTVVMNRRGNYRVEWSGSVEGEAAGTVQLSLELPNDAVLAETTRQQYIAAADQPACVSTGTIIKNCCSAYNSVAVTNTGTEPVIVQAGSCLEIGYGSGGA